MNISGGSIDGNFDAENNSVVNISGGTLGENFNAFNGSAVNISGGTFGSNFDALPGSTVALSGGEFQLNGLALLMRPSRSAEMTYLQARWLMERALSFPLK